MAISSVGLKTHLWNNNIKSLLFLLLYPILVTFAYLSLFATILLYSSINTRHTSTKIDFPEVFQRLALDYWYAPFAGMLVFLVLLYCHHSNRMDMRHDMRPVTRDNHPQLYDTLENLCISRGMTMPYFFIQNYPACNAYTRGLTPHTYCIIVTSGLLKKFTSEEVRSVLAHELSHIIHGDTRFIFLTSSITSLFHRLFDQLWPQTPKEDYTPYLPDTEKKDGLQFLLGAILGFFYIGILFTQLFISRKREYMADAGAVELTQDPTSLISALQKIEENIVDFHNDPKIKYSLLHYRNRGGLPTHPSIQNRIAAIQFFSRKESSHLSPSSGKNIRQAIKTQEDVIW